MKPLLLLPPVIFAGLAAMFYVGMMRDDQGALPSARSGQIAPAMTLEPFGDDPVLTTLAGGVKLVNFWASWCGPCRAEHPMLEQLASEGVEIVGLNYKDRPADAMGFLAELGDPYAVKAADAQGRTGLDWGLYGVPETFVLDANGKIITRLAGPITASNLESTIRPALAAAQVPQNVR